MFFAEVLGARLSQQYLLQSNQPYMVELLRDTIKPTVPAQDPPREISRRSFLQGALLGTASAAFENSSCTKFVAQMADNALGPYSSERHIQEEATFIHNEHIGIQPSSYLPGLIDLKYNDPDTEEWKVYNVVVPNVVANGLDINAEIFCAHTKMEHDIDENGDTNFTIAYEKYDGVKIIDGQPNVGNGAHFEINGKIPHDKSEVTFALTPREDSAPIEKFSIANYFGQLTDVNRLETSDGHHIRSEDFKDPDDGNFEQGDFYQLPVPPQGSLRFYNTEKDMIQTQQYTNATEIDFEIRRHPWRPEFGETPRTKWIEAVRVWQTPDPQQPAEITFGYHIGK